MRTKIRDTKNGSFAPSEHREFVRNKDRVKTFRKAFEKHARGKVVLDVGTGSGIMAILAAKAGAKRVIAIEKDEKMAEVARRNFEKNGLTDQIELIVGDALEVPSLPRVEVLVGELLSTWCVVEPQVPVFKHLLGAIEGTPETIPGRIINQVEGVRAIFGDDDGLVEIPQVYFEFTETDKAKTMTGRKNASEIVFSEDMDLNVDITVKLKAIRDGKINALRLSSITETCEEVQFEATNDTMPDMIVPLPNELLLRKGDEVQIRIQYEYGKGWNSLKISEVGN